MIFLRVSVCMTERERKAKVIVNFSLSFSYYYFMEKISRLYFASSSDHKKTEMQRLVKSGIEIIIPRQIGYDFNPDENGQSFIENALIKAKALYSVVKEPVLADDSGLVVDALGGRPGIHTARYGCEGGIKLTSRQQYTMLLDEMKGQEDRSARFVSACVLMLGEERIYIVQETVEGSIALEPDGENGFGYDPVFLIAEAGKTAARLSDSEKDHYSHRGRAMRKINQLLSQGENSDEKK